MTYLGPARQSDRSRGIGALPALVIASALSLVVAACGSSTSSINPNDASVNGKGGTTGGTGTGGTSGGTAGNTGTGTGGAQGAICGGAGQACCASNTCNGGGCCVGGMCVGAGTTCGNGNTTGTCTNGSCQNAAGTACGAIGQICCGANGGNTCTASGARCTQAGAGGGADAGAATSMCTACGTNGAACCQGAFGGGGGVATCDTGLSCQGGGGGAAQMCAPCGGDTRRAVRGNLQRWARLRDPGDGGGAHLPELRRAQRRLLRRRHLPERWRVQWRHERRGRHLRPCGASGQVCCAANSATPASAAAPRPWPAPRACARCAVASGQACCAAVGGAMACTTGLSCIGAADDNPGTCGVCGAAGQACCAGNTCAVGFACVRGAAVPTVERRDPELHGLRRERPALLQPGVQRRPHVHGQGRRHAGTCG